MPIFNGLGDEDEPAEETMMEKLGIGGKLGVCSILKSQWKECFRRECCVECHWEQSDED